jgi:Domain of unknown function (DUF5916)/Carbohydrate family 9 binding domain-like
VERREATGVVPGSVAVLALVAAVPCGAATREPGGGRLEAALGPRTLTATRVHGVPPVVDGRLDDPAWNGAEVATDLVQRRPDPGSLATVRTEARFLYDAEALYVGVRLLDPDARSIVAPYPRRDDETTSDWVFVELDTRLDRRTAFSFGLNPRGVQVDGAFANDVDYDPTWNGVWEGSARIDASGWTAEYRIPFSQLVYSTGRARETSGLVPATFGMNVYRYSPSRGESSNWSPRLPSLSGVVSKFNALRLEVPSRTRRLEVVPYVSSEAKAPGQGPFTRAVGASGGADLRLGLGSSFTLTAAVHPDFGQVEADPSEVNLTTFETFQTERRPLFVENAGLLAFDTSLPFTTRGDSFASEQAFYSRRIGRPPRLQAPAGSSFAETPATVLLGAAKLTGRTASGWSVGALGALTGSEDARYVDGGGRATSLRVEPGTASGVARVSRDFRGGDGAAGAMVTFLERSRMTPVLGALLPRRAMAAGADGRLRFGGERYEASAFVLGSALEGSRESIAAVFGGPGHYAQRPDASGSERLPAGRAAYGFASQARLAKVGGDHWRWTLAGRAVTPRLETNDLGFQRNADWLVAFGALTYQEDHPGRLFRRWTVGTNQVGWGWSFAGDRRAAVFDVSANADLLNFWGGSLSYEHELPALQTEALHGGPALLAPSRDSLALSFYSDTRRTSQATLDVRGMREAATGGHDLAVSPSFVVRTSDRLTVTLSPSFERAVNSWQPLEGVPEGRVLVARLDQRTAAVTVRADLAFSPHLTLQVYAQPFASAGRFDRLGEVAAPRATKATDRVRLFDPATVGAGSGSLRIDEGTGDPLVVADPSFHVRSLRANVVLRWEYRPGSTVYAVWSQSREASAPGASFDPLGEPFHAFDARARNVFLVKLTYWLAPRH